uniref:hypothetical protein n=1 Tax=Vibrio cholerae TaxID=666 RepID=UPI003F58E2E8
MVLGATTTQGVIHLLSDAVKVDAGTTKRSVVTITRTGKFYDPRYGEFELTQSMFDSMIKNFNDGVYGQDIFIDIAHKPEDGAGAVVKRLFTDRGRLRAEVEWFELGIHKVTKEGFSIFLPKYIPTMSATRHLPRWPIPQFGPTL